MPSSVRFSTAVALLSLMVAASPPAQASEVVKLARLVITGKWLNATPAASPKTEKFPRVVVEGHAMNASEQVAREGRGLVLPI